jgi:hypothetical protein
LGKIYFKYVKYETDWVGMYYILDLDNNGYILVAGSIASGIWLNYLMKNDMLQLLEGLRTLYLITLQNKDMKK